MSAELIARSWFATWGSETGPAEEELFKELRESDAELVNALKGLVSVADQEGWHNKFSLFGSKNLAAAKARHIISKFEPTADPDQSYNEFLDGKPAQKRKSTKKLKVRKAVK